MINVNSNSNIRYNMSQKFPQRINSLQKSAGVSFKGHYQAHVTNINDLGRLNHQTSFFRNIEIKEFVKSYIVANFSHKDKINFLVGACSTGEEAYSYKMMLKDLGNKLHIKGFDVNKEVVDSANSGVFTLERDDVRSMRSGGLDDQYLVFNTLRLSNSQKKYKKLFYEYFKPTNDDVIYNPLLKLIFRVGAPEKIQKSVKLKNPERDRIEFVQGDILKLSKVTKGEKVDVLTFSNALYHLILEDSFNSPIITMKKDAEEIVGEVIRNIRENLNTDGILVFGKNERLQMYDSEFKIPNIILKSGFTPIKNADYNYPNVWRKIN